MSEDFYSLLGVARDAEAADIKKAYRLKAQKLHPDAGGDAETFYRLKDAFDCLSDPLRRAAYDSHGDNEASSDPQRLRIMEMIAFALDQSLLKLQQDIRNVTPDDIVTLMIDQLNEHRSQLLFQEKQFEKALIATNTLDEKRSRAGDMLALVLSQRRATCEKRLAELSANLTTTNMALTELQRSGTYRPDSPFAAHNHFDWVDVHRTVG